MRILTKNLKKPLTRRRHRCQQLTPWSSVILHRLIVRSTRQESNSLLWNPKVYYLFHESPPLVFIPNQINLNHTTYLFIINIHFNSVLPSTPRSAERSLTLRLYNENFVLIPHLPMRILSNRLILLGLITLIMFGEE